MNEYSTYKLKTYNLKSYKYLVDSFNISFPNSEDSVIIDKKQITFLSFEKDYDHDFFPLIKLGVTLDINLYYKILDNKLDVRFRMRFQKYGKDSSDANFNFKNDVFNALFTIFIDDNTPFMDKKEYLASKNTDGTDTSPKDISNEFTFYLFKEDDVMNTRKIINNVISGGNMTDAISYISSEAGFNKILLSPLDNSKYYNEILLPPLTSLGNLLYLEQQYGFYKNGSTIFFDVDRTYIIDKTPKSTAWTEGEFILTLFTIQESANVSNFVSGSYVDEFTKTYYINITSGGISLFNESVIADQTEGNNFISINPAKNDIQTKYSDTVQRGDGTYKILVNRFGNPYVESMRIFKKGESCNIVHISISDFDLDCISPNKTFIFIFENSEINKEYGGNYRIIKSVVNFTKDGEEFKINGDLEFRKYDR